MKILSRLIVFALVSTVQFVAAQKKSTEHWESMFNGKDLTGWTPKIRNYPAGENFGNTEGASVNRNYWA